MIRSSVVLPQPLGPTRVMNSRSGSSGSTSFSTSTAPNDFQMCSSRIVTAPASALHGAGAEPGHEMTLHQHEEDRHRHGHQHRGGHHQAPIDVRALEEMHHTDGERQVLDRV